MNKGGGGGGGGGGRKRGGLTALSSGFDVMFPQKFFKTKFPSLLTRFIMTIDGKHMTSSVDYFAMTV